MKQLNYQTLQDLNYDGYLLKDAPERILQFGEGNFMRAFVDFFIDKMNETADFNSKVVLVQPIAKIHDSRCWRFYQRTRRTLHTVPARFRKWTGSLFQTRDFLCQPLFKCIQ